MKAVVIFLVLLLTGCATVPGDFPYKEEPPKAYGTPTSEMLKYYDHLDQEIITVAVITSIKPIPGYVLFNTKAPFVKIT